MARSCRLLTKWLALAALQAGLVTCVALLIFELVLLLNHRTDRQILLWVMLGCTALSWVLIALHELGHAAAAVGMQLLILRMVVGPIRWVREGLKLRTRFNRAFYQQSFVSVVPRHDRNLRSRMAVFAASGPAANLVAAIICLAGGHAYLPSTDSFVWPLELGHFRAEDWSLDTRWWLYIAALINGLLCFANMIPLRFKGLATDGATLFDWLEGGRRAMRDALTLTLNSALIGGMRPREWSADLVAQLLSLRDQSTEDAAANLIGYYYSLDCGDLDLAGELLQLAAEQSAVFAPGFRTGILLEAAYFYAFQRGDLKTAQNWWKSAKGGDVEKQTWLRAEAAILFAEGRYAESAAKAESGLALIPHSWDTGGSRAEKEWLEAIVQRSRQARSVCPSVHEADKPQVTIPN